MGTSAVFGTAVFGQAVFGISMRQNTPYVSLADYVSAVESVDDSAYMATLPFREAGTRRQKLLLIQSG